MTINPLPQSTVHLLGSAQTLTNSLSLVKELVDNALDAKATAVDVLISKDTLEKIEVRDNGYGISQNDFEALGCRGHTSKLRSFDELTLIGGVSLGFRGEALASAVQLGQVTVITKTEGEAVATSIVLKAPGGVHQKTKISHPVGTTICVKNFLAKIPVRRQTALKSASKTLNQIKELLLSYVFARPTVKFSLKVAKESKGSWSFVPRTSEGFRGVAIQMIGRDAVAECFERTLAFAERDSHQGAEGGEVSSQVHDHTRTSSTESQFVMEMLLPKPGADSTKISYGQYFSVDSRPVANDKGTMKRITSLFKSYLKNSYEEGERSIQNPFFRLNIVCPTASYDPNVEPAKDDILFGNEPLLLQSIESFFKDFYGELRAATAPTSKTKLLAQMDKFELTLARKPQTTVKNALSTPPCSIKRSDVFSQFGGFRMSTSSTEITDPLTVDETAQHEDFERLVKTTADKNFKWGMNMSEVLSEEVEVHNPIRPAPQLSSSIEAAAIDKDDEEDVRSSLNPWVIAKLTAPAHPVNEVTATLPTPTSKVMFNPRDMPTPGPSSDPVMPDDFNQTPISSVVGRHRILDRNNATDSSVEGQSLFLEEIGENTSLPWLRMGTHLQRESHDISQDKPSVTENNLLPSHVRNDFVSARNLTELCAASSAIPQCVELPKKTTAGLDKPFVSLLVDAGTHSNRDNLRQTTLYVSQQSSRESSEVRNNQEQRTAEEADLAWAMDFENRKEALSREQRQQRKEARSKATMEIEDTRSTAARPRTSPHKNRYVAAIACLETGQHTSSPLTQQPPKSLIPDGDPRSYLMRRQRSMAANSVNTIEISKPSRLKSNRLPLERVPEGSQLHSLALDVTTSVGILRGISDYIGKQDSYMTTGALAIGLPLGEEDVPEVTRTFQQMASAWKDAQADENMEIESAFHAI